MAEDAPGVVVVGMDVVPDERLAADDLGEGADGLWGDDLRDDAGPGPEDVDRGGEQGADGGEVRALCHGGLGARVAVLGGAEHDAAVWVGGDDGVGDIDLGVGRGGKDVGVLGAQVGLNVVKEDGKAGAAEAADLLELVEDTVQLLGVGEGNVQAGRQGIGEDNRVHLGLLNEMAQVALLVGRVWVAPAAAVLEVVLGRIEVVGHAPLGHAGKEVQALRGFPGLAVEALDGAREEGRRGLERAGHKAQPVAVHVHRHRLGRECGHKGGWRQGVGAGIGGGRGRGGGAASGASHCCILCSKARRWRGGARPRRQQAWQRGGER